MSECHLRGLRGHLGWSRAGVGGAGALPGADAARGAGAVAVAVAPVVLRARLLAAQAPPPGPPWAGGRRAGRGGQRGSFPRCLNNSNGRGEGNTVQWGAGFPCPPHVAPLPAVLPGAAVQHRLLSVLPDKILGSYPKSPTSFFGRCSHACRGLCCVVFPQWPRPNTCGPSFTFW